MAESPAKSSPGLLARVRAGLVRTRQVLGLGLQEVFQGRTRVDDELYARLEQALLEGDLGVAATARLLAAVSGRVRTARIEDPVQVRGILKEEIRALLAAGARAEEAHEAGERPLVWLVVGVNGVGK